MDSQTKFLECFLTFLTYRLSKLTFPPELSYNLWQTLSILLQISLNAIFLTPFAHFPRLTFEKSLNEKLRKAINQFAQLLFCGLNCLLFMSHEKLSLEIFLSLCDRNQWTNIVNWQTFVKHFCISHFDISKISKHFIWISNDSFNCRKSCAKPNALIFYFNFSSMWLMFSTFFLPISLPQSFIVCCRRTCEMLKLFCEICWKNVESFICEWKKEK